MIDRPSTGCQRPHVLAAAVAREVSLPSPPAGRIFFATLLTVRLSPCLSGATYRSTLFRSSRVLPLTNDPMAFGLISGHETPTTTLSQLTYYIYTTDTHSHAMKNSTSFNYDTSFHTPQACGAGPVYVIFQPIRIH